MRKLIVLSMVSLDGVMQAPSGPEEDPSGVFKHGGWTSPYSDEVGGKAVRNELKLTADYLLGRKTFEIWEDYWPQHTDLWPGINEGTKYILSTSRHTTDWNNSIFLNSTEDIIKLKGSKGPDIQVWGSSEVVHLLFKNDLIDELRLKIHPLVLGKGKKIFDDDSYPTAFKLTDSTVTGTGVILANYARHGKVTTAIKS